MSVSNIDAAKRTNLGPVDLDPETIEWLDHEPALAILYLQACQIVRIDIQIAVKYLP